MFPLSVEAFSTTESIHPHKLPTCTFTGLKEPSFSAVMNSHGIFSSGLISGGMSSRNSKIITDAAGTLSGILYLPEILSIRCTGSGHERQSTLPFIPSLTVSSITSASALLSVILVRTKPKVPSAANQPEPGTEGPCHGKVSSLLRRTDV